MPNKAFISFSTMAPSLRCRPDRVNGIPIFLEILALAAEIPKNLFQEKPPLFMAPPEVILGHVHRRFLVNI